MVYRKSPLAPGLYLVATPIGTARDITLRALDILASADVLAAEDTRTLRHLMEIHGIPLEGRRVVAYHDHSPPAVRDRLVAGINEGQSVAYASEAGTPLVADPGFTLARDVRAAGAAVHTAPGPSALLAALTVSGLPSDRFHFVGFPPTQTKARRALFSELKDLPATLIFYEAPGRLGKMLADAAYVWGPARRVAICRELTKRFEEVRRGPVGELAEIYRSSPPKGEIVVLVDREEPVAASDDVVEAALRAALADMSVKAAAAEVAETLGIPRRRAYQMALTLENKQ